MHYNGSNLRVAYDGCETAWGVRTKFAHDRECHWSCDSDGDNPNGIPSRDANSDEWRLNRMFPSCAWPENKFPQHIAMPFDVKDIYKMDGPIRYSTFLAPWYYTGDTRENMETRRRT